MMAAYPAPMASWSTPVPTVVDTILRAISGAAPEQVPAAHFGTLGAPMTFFGMHPKTGRRFVVQSIEGGGWGGRPHQDGMSGSVSVCQGDVRNAPIEGLEMKFPIRVEERAILPDSGGAGLHRGGFGLKTTVRNLVDGTWNMSMPGREVCPPWGLWGGSEGTVGHYELELAGSETRERVNGARRPAAAGSVVYIQTGGGGGWGSPFERPAQAVLDDVRNGYVSIEAARRDYGVVLTGAGADLELDIAATKARRAALTPAAALD
jgi:N-methylhydantoinase B